MGNVIKLSPVSWIKKTVQGIINLAPFLLHQKGGCRRTKQADQKICFKDLFKEEKLCYPIEEADRRLITNFAFVLTIRADRQNILAN